MNISEILEQVTSIRVLVVGDVMVDHYIWGDVTRISPEAPVPIVHVNNETDTAGGASNVALNLASLGVKTELIGCIGDDSQGRRLIQKLTEASIHVGRSVVSENVPTIVKTRLMARTQQICRIDFESTRADYVIHQNQTAMVNLASAVAEADAVIISYYAKGVITQELVDLIIRLGKEHGKLVAIDPKPARKLNITGAGLMTPNRTEALELSGILDLAQGDAYPLAEVAQRIHDRFAPDILVITLGADGMALCRGGRVEHTMSTAASEVFDVSGAGDTAIATLTAALAAKVDAVSATRFANLAAGLVVAKMGTATTTRSEVLTLAEVTKPL
jgi:D-beta-D-heptose 7-phosphate kinase/D-beta-D-heptose 1-phosphate adenosyltransferase